MEHKQVPESENPKTDAKEEKESDGTSDKKDKKEKKSCCKKCKAKAKLMKQKLKGECVCFVPIRSLKVHNSNFFLSL